PNGGVAAVAVRLVSIVGSQTPGKDLGSAARAHGRCNPEGARGCCGSRGADPGIRTPAAGSALGSIQSARSAPSTGAADAIRSAGGSAKPRPTTDTGISSGSRERYDGGTSETSGRRRASGFGTYSNDFENS